MAELSQGNVSGRFRLMFFLVSDLFPIFPLSGRRACGSHVPQRGILMHSSLPGRGGQKVAGKTSGLAHPQKSKVKRDKYETDLQHKPRLVGMKRKQARGILAATITADVERLCASIRKRGACCF